MDTVLRALAMYAFLLVIFRVGGKRSLAQITAFDFVLLLIINGLQAWARKRLGR